MPLHYMCLNKNCNRNTSQLQSFLEQRKTRHKTKQHSLQDPRKHLSDKRLPTMRLGDACHASLFSRRILQKFISGTGVGKTSHGAAEQNSLNRYFVKSSKKEARGQSFQIDRNFRFQQKLGIRGFVGEGGREGTKGFKEYRQKARIKAKERQRPKISKNRAFGALRAPLSLFFYF